MTEKTGKKHYQYQDAGKIKKKDTRVSILLF